MTTQHDERAELIANRIVNIAWRFRAADSMEKLQAVEAELRAALLAADTQAGGEVVAYMVEAGPVGAVSARKLCHDINQAKEEAAAFAKVYAETRTVPCYTHPHPQAVAEGWKLVPVEPTKEMLSHVCNCRKDCYSEADGYRAMLSASPAAPAAAQVAQPLTDLKDQA